jgi:hypothetical protein
MNVDTIKDSTIATPLEGGSVLKVDVLSGSILIQNSTQKEWLILTHPTHEITKFTN